MSLFFTGAPKLADIGCTRMITNKNHVSGWLLLYKKWFPQLEQKFTQKEKKNKFFII